MSISQMRKKLATLYPGDSWKAKVAGMSDNQVMAIYFSKQEKNQLKPVPSKECKGQMTIFDYI